MYAIYVRKHKDGFGSRLRVDIKCITEYRGYFHIKINRGQGISFQGERGCTIITVMMFSAN